MNGNYEVFTICWQFCSLATLFLLVTVKLTIDEISRHLPGLDEIKSDKFLQMECNGIKCHLSLFFSKLRHSKQEIQQQFQFYSTTFISILLLKIQNIKKIFCFNIVWTIMCGHVYMIPVQVLDTDPRGNDVGMNLCINRKIQLKL